MVKHRWIRRGVRSRFISRPLLENRFKRGGEIFTFCMQETWYALAQS
jgi:hypothetical protein